MHIFEAKAVMWDLLCRRLGRDPENTTVEQLADLHIIMARWGRVCRAYGWNPDTTTAETVIARFDQLGEAKERKEALKEKRKDG